MKTTETILLIGLGGVIAYLVFGGKGGASTAKSIGGQGGGSRGGFEPDLRSVESIDVIETKPPINVTVNTNSHVPTSAPTQPTTEPPQPTTTEAETTTQAPSAAFNGRPKRRSDDGFVQRFTVMDNTNFPIHSLYHDEEDMD